MESLKEKLKGCKLLKDIRFCKSFTKCVFRAKECKEVPYDRPGVIP